MNGPNRVLSERRWPHLEACSPWEALVNLFLILCLEQEDLFIVHKEQYVSLCQFPLCLHFQFSQFSSVAQLCLTLCDLMNRSTPGLPVHHQLPEFTQTHVHQVSDAIQPSNPLSSPSPAPNPSQHQSLFQ